MADRTLFSILVPVYNVERWLPECLDSVLGQTERDFELLLVDDGATDRSGPICDEYAARDQRIRVFHKENGGLMSARRYAVERAEGEYFVFMDSDDRLSPGALETLRRAVETSGADCVIYGIRWEKPDGVEHLTTPPELCGRLLTDKREVLLHLLSDDAYNSLCRKCARRSCFDGRDFSPWFHIRSGEDMVQSTEILENAQSFYFLPDELYVYRANDSSITHTIRYDSYRARFETSRFVDDWLERLDILTGEDWQRHIGSTQDMLLVDVKRVCRFCSGPDKARPALKSITENAYYREKLSGPYRGAARGLRGLFNRVTLALLRRERFGALLFFCNRIYRAR